MSVVIKRLQQSAGSAQSLKVGTAPKGFFPNISHNDNSFNAVMQPETAPSAMAAAYDALAQESFMLGAPADDKKGNWSLDWY